MCKSIKYIYWVKKDLFGLVWACLKGVTSEKTLKEKSTNKNYYDDNYSASITRCSLLRLIYLPYFLTNINATVLWISLKLFLQIVIWNPFWNDCDFHRRRPIQSHTIHCYPHFYNFSNNHTSAILWFDWHAEKMN